MGPMLSNAEINMDIPALMKWLNTNEVYAKRLIKPILVKRLMKPQYPKPSLASNVQ